MTLTKIYQVEDNKVIISLPAIFRNRKELLITVNDVADSKISKLNALKSTPNRSASLGVTHIQPFGFYRS
jgi:hypothetical protein